MLKLYTSLILNLRDNLEWYYIYYNFFESFQSTRRICPTWHWKGKDPFHNNFMEWGRVSDEENVAIITKHENNN